MKFEIEQLHEIQQLTFHLFYTVWHSRIKHVTVPPRENEHFIGLLTAIRTLQTIKNLLAHNTMHLQAGSIIPLLSVRDNA